MIASQLTFEQDVPMAPMTTLEVGGTAHRLVRLPSEAAAHALVEWWTALPPEQRPALLPLGGGSNLLVSDGGFPGLVVKLENQTLEVLSQEPERVRVRVGAGLTWDDFVEQACRHAWAGVECLSGIPGSVGAAPVQNIGAYGQEVAETLVAVEGYDLETGRWQRFSREECGFAYRDSRFKRAGLGRYLLLAVELELRPGGAPTVRYKDLQERSQERRVETLLELRELVLEVRRSKSMVYDRRDPNHRSAGSFFTNPVVPREQAAELVARTGMPCYPAGPDTSKLSAAWLIEHSGLPRGFRPHPEARVGLSTNHVLALTNRGGASAQELWELAQLVQEKVWSSYAVRLVPEPVLVGF